MNDKTAEIIKQLADKLGTTAEHLWGVLIKQAPISSSIDLMFDAILIGLMAYVWVKLVKHDADAEDKIMLGIILTIVCGVAALAMMASLPTTIAGFVNPEYWALKQLLSSK
jgi:hypothetical protein